MFGLHVLNPYEGQFTPVLKPVPPPLDHVGKGEKMTAAVVAKMAHARNSITPKVSKALIIAYK